SLVEADPAVAAAAESASGPRVRWQREGNELHGDRVIRIGAVPTRAHVEVEVRPVDVLVQRGLLVVLLDLGIVAALWALSALADGGFGRWVRARGRGWSRSYRARLTLALFTFFVVPAVAFAVWSYRRLQGDDAQSRELLVLETLRAVTAAEDFRQLEAVSDRLDTPLLLYEGGELRAASDTLYEALAPTGRFLPAPVFLRLGLGEEVTARSVEHVGELDALFGYRAVPGAGGPEGRLVLAAPARTNEVALDRRRRDLGVLVLFATALGALAALWLSGIAAREFARPIGALREAALAVAAGEREPVLGGEPPSEFEQVFSAFRRMAADLDASRSALEEAQRRTAAVLRNVASGVVAVDRRGSVSLANPRADALLGHRLPPGTPLAAVAPPEVVERVAAFVRHPLEPLGAASGEIAGEEEEEFDLQLEGRQLHARLTRLLRGGGGAVLTLDDVTEVARAQRVLAWGEMARQVAHEIKNPLTPIRLGVQHLRRARADARPDFDRILERNVERILAEIDRLDEIARAFSRYGTAPTERPAAAPTDVAAVTRDVVALERMGAGGVRWALDGAEEPAVALAREEELREVLLNVLENARLAHARTVSVAVGRDDGRVRIAVRDDGEGIPPEVLPRIFEPHFSTRTSGSGLGLAISRRIIDGWGGEITVSSRRGEGTEVTISLVAEDPAAA
ncbi:MAG TPA: ATP-binding protein, partial [Gemmatimonadaceae bacterium]|nr:ATP-binding protein [Gemmatimonadaceae bacterium]